MPDIELPEAVPVNVIAKLPTVPNVILPPLRVPLIGIAVSPRSEIVIMPDRSDPDCVHVSMNVPSLAPEYCPDHEPESPPELEALLEELADAQLLATKALRLASAAFNFATFLAPRSLIFSP